MAIFRNIIGLPVCHDKWRSSKQIQQNALEPDVHLNQQNSVRMTKALYI